MRIIGGSARGRQLKSPKGMLTRPTLDSTRESLFNILANYGLHGARVLDVFAGTGALGIEALSRGADYCAFVDHYTQRLIQQNADACGFKGQYDVYRMESHRALAKLAGQEFHYIFADPPYHKNLVNDTIFFIFKYNLLASGGMIIMEHSCKEPVVEDPLYRVIREKTYGKETRVSFICRNEEGDPTCV